MALEDAALARVDLGNSHCQVASPQREKDSAGTTCHWQPERNGHMSYRSWVGECMKSRGGQDLWSTCGPRCRRLKPEIFLEKTESWPARRRVEPGARPSQCVTVLWESSIVESLLHASQYFSAGPLDSFSCRHFHSSHAAYHPHNVLARAYGGTNPPCDTNICKKCHFNTTSN